MYKPKQINGLLTANDAPRGGGLHQAGELLPASGPRLAALKARSQARARILEHVRAALPTPLAATVVSAGLEHGRLSVGVAGAVWATRLRYVTDTLRTQVSAATGLEVQSVRIRVVPPSA